jgi:pimeloyl-ACP methyl ester carboxylesterase
LIADVGALPGEVVWATRFTDLRYYHHAERGGHFAAFEQPEIFVQEVRDSIRAVR